jgi:hypothetical protein
LTQFSEAPVNGLCLRHFDEFDYSLVETRKSRIAKTDQEFTI